MKFDRIVVMARCRVMSVNLKRSDRESLFRIADIKRRCLAQHRVWVMGVMFRYCKISHGLVVVIARDDERSGVVSLLLRVRKHHCDRFAVPMDSRVLHDW